MIQTSDSSRIYAGNNSTTIPYPVPFKFFQDEDLFVVVKDQYNEETSLILGTDYTVTGKGDPNGGSLKTTSPVAVTSFVSISRIVAMTQLVSYEEGDAFPAKSHEGALDKLTMEVQQLSLNTGTGTGTPTDIGGCFRVTTASSGFPAIPKKIDTTLGVGSDGNAILRTAGEMLGWLGQVGTVWADTPARLGTRGAYAGQLGVQFDNRTIYIALSTTPGDWLPFLIGTGIVAATDGVPHLLTPPAGDLVGTDQAQTLYNKTLESPTIHAPTGLTKNDVGLGNVDNTSDLNKPLSSATGAALSFKQDKAEKGISNGYPSLDGGGKIPIAQIPDALIGASQYQGTWNAATNTPTIPAAAIGNKGWYYAVAVAGTTNINGISSWAVGDQIISNGTVWQKIVNVSAVSSVNSKTGAVVLVPADINLGNVDNTSDATKNAAAVTLTNHTITGANNTLTVRLDADVTNNLPVNRLNNGTGASGTTWWCGDNSWKQPPGTGDVNGPTGSGDGELCLYSGTTGKVIRRFSGTSGFAKANTTGVLTTQAKMLSGDLDPDVIGGQPELATLSYLDYLLVREAASGLLKKAPAKLTSKLPRNYLSGGILSNNVSDTANDIDVAAGICRSDDDLVDIAIPAITKRLDAAWAAGTNQGGRDTGVIADGPWHIYVIMKEDRTTDILMTATYGSPTMPSGYIYKRRLGSLVRCGAGGLRSFKQLGDYFQIVDPADNHAGASIAQGGTFLGNLGSIANGAVPKGLKFLVDLAITNTHSAGLSYSFVYDPDSLQPSRPSLYTSATANSGSPGRFFVWCNNGGDVRITAGPQTGTFAYYFSVLGYWDPRDKDR